jgi:hypothetical protein
MYVVLCSLFRVVIGIDVWICHLEDFLADDQPDGGGGTLHIFKHDPVLREMLENSDAASKPKKYASLAVLPALAFSYAQAILAHRFHDMSIWTDPLRILNERNEHNGAFQIILGMLKKVTKHENLSRKGDMLVIRAQDKRTAELFRGVLIECRRIAGYERLFEIVLDISSDSSAFEKDKGFIFTNKESDAFKNVFLPQMREWNAVRVEEDVSTWYPTAYEDLRGLPCFLIVVEKARFGDTLPDNFTFFDLRARNISQVGALSSFRQDVGRACGYSKVNGPNTRPHIIVSKTAADVLDPEDEAAAVSEDLHLNTDNTPSNSHRFYKIYANDYSAGAPVPEDQHMPTFVKRKQADEQFELETASEERERRRQVGESFLRKLLFCAEPQIGKTGSYLRALKRLQNPGFYGQDGLVLRYVPLNRLKGGSFHWVMASEEGDTGGSPRMGWLDDIDAVKQHPQPLKQLQALLAAELGESSGMDWGDYEVTELTASTDVTTDANVQQLPLNAHLKITKKAKAKMSQAALVGLLQQQGFSQEAIKMLLTQQSSPAQPEAKKQRTN